MSKRGWLENEFGTFESFRILPKTEDIPKEWPGVIELILQEREKMTLDEIVTKIMSEWFDNEEPITPARIEGYLRDMIGSRVAENADGTYTLLSETEVR